MVAYAKDGTAVIVSFGRVGRYVERGARGGFVSLYRSRGITFLPRQNRKFE